MLWLLLASLVQLTQSAPTGHKLHESMSKDDVETLLGVPLDRLHDAPPYDLTTPIRVKDNGEYLTHDLETDHAKTRRIEMTAAHSLPLHFNFTAFGETYTLEVKTDLQFVSSSFFFDFRGDNDHRNIVYDVHACHYSGKVKSHSHVESIVTIDNCDGNLRGAIQMEDDHFIIQPLPDHLAKGQHNHIVTKRATSAAEIGDDDPLPTPPTLNFVPIVPMCDTTNETLAIEAEKFVDDYQNSTKRDESLEEDGGRLRVIESMMVVDCVASKKHGNKITNYVIKLLHIASSLYHRDRLDFNFRLVLKYCIVYTDCAVQEEQLGGPISQDSRKNLDTFSDWQADNNDPIEGAPKHFDHAFLLTGNGMCFGREEDCWELGRAWIKGVCTTRFRASVNSDKGLPVGYVLAHELGHNLGMQHDGYNSKCSSSDGFVMAPSVSAAKNIFSWSQCSKGYLLDTIQTGAAKCLDNCVSNFKPGFGKKSYAFPGAMYSLDEQCALIFPGTKHCSFADRNICTELWCQRTDGRCTTLFTGAADGTPCASRKICFNRKCFDEQTVLMPNLPDDDLCDGPGCSSTPDRPIRDGQWGPWERKGECSRTCGVGFVEEERKCNNPAPDNCGFDCEGNSTQVVTCNPNPCPLNAGEAPEISRAQPCKDLGKRTGVSDLKPWPYDESCSLLCVSASRGQIFAGGNVPNGLRCNSVTNNRCYDGKCTQLGCNNKIGSNAQYDQCGVCGGDGSTCTRVKCSYPSGIQQTRNQFYPFGTIPVGAKNIEIKEDEEGSYLYPALKLNSRTTVGGTGRAIQFVEGAGTTFYYRRTTGNPDSLIGGLTAATTTEVEVQALIFGSSGCQPGLTYSYILPASAGTPPPCTKYVWSQKEQQCSKCGEGGTQTPIVECRRTKDGKAVKESRCPASSKPRPIPQSCCGDCKSNPTPCGNYKWITKKYGQCSKTCGGGTQTRRVLCRDLMGNNVGEYNCCKLGRKSSSKSCNQQDCP